MTIKDVATQIAKDRSKWMTAQFKKILPNRLFCIVRNHQEGIDDRMYEVANYLTDEQVNIDVSALDARIYKKGRLIATWTAEVNISEPAILQVHKPIVITDGK